MPSMLKHTVCALHTIYTTYEVGLHFSHSDIDMRRSGSIGSSQNITVLSKL